MDKDQIFAILERVLSICKRAEQVVVGARLCLAQAEACLIASSVGLTRFAHGYVHQNVFHQDNALTIRVALGNKLGAASTNSLDEDGLSECTASALKIAQASPPDPDFPGFPQDAGQVIEAHFDEATSLCSPEARLEKIKAYIEAAKGVRASGALETAVHWVGIMNSRGLQNFGGSTKASFESVVSVDDSTGYAVAIKPAVNDIDFGRLGVTAAKKAIEAKEPCAVEPGLYTVILEPPAVATLVGMLGYMGFGAKAYQEGTSFLAKKFSTQVVSQAVTLWDAASHPMSLGLSFDREGVFKQKVMLIERGRAVGMVHDSMTAAKAGVQSTGHAVSETAELGPIPVNLALEPGSSSLEQMIAETERGLLITRFHYSNILDYLNTVITGMTRDGTFLIEKGRVVAAVKNLRFTQNILEALENVEAIGNQLESIPSPFGRASLVPALKLSRFHFTGVAPF